MAISLYSGTPGSGKSLHAAERIYHILRAGLPVVCNFPIALEKLGKKKLGPFYYISNEDLSPSALVAISDEWFSSHRFREETILLVIDEAQLIFNARSWTAKGRDMWVSFFTQHRKYGYRVVLIAQFDRMLDRQIRSLLEYEFVHRKVSNFGVAGKVMSAAALGKMFVAVKVWYPLNEKVGSEWYVAKKRYYRIYDTYSRFGADSRLSGAAPPPNVEGAAADAPPALGLLQVDVWRGLGMLSDMLALGARYSCPVACV